MGGPTGCWTLNSSEHNGIHAPYRSAGDVCSLSDVLETGSVPPRFSLSAKACSGILRRAERRGKALPEKNRAWARRRFFRNKAARRCGATAEQLFGLWVRQRGRCALSGKKLDRTAHLDHVLPKARGGADCISNYRWVAPEVNLMKRDLTDTEFMAICRDCMAWIGERIAAVDSRHDI